MKYFVILVLALFGAGCDVADDPQELPGTWSVRAADGSCEVLELAQNGTFTEVRPAGAVAGTWSASPSDITFNTTDGSESTAPYWLVDGELTIRETTFSRGACAAPAR